MIWPFKKREVAVQMRESFPSRQELQETASALVAAYDDYLQASPLGPGCFRDASRLPYPKNTIINGFLAALAFERREEVRQALVVKGFSLTQFREGVGRTELSPVPNSQEVLNGLSDDAFVSEMSKHELAFERWEGFAKEQKAEVAKLRGLFERAINSRPLAKS